MFLLFFNFWAFSFFSLFLLAFLFIFEFFTVGQVKGNARDGRSRYQPTKVFEFVKLILRPQKSKQTVTSAGPTLQMRHPNADVLRSKPLPRQGKSDSSINNQRNRALLKHHCPQIHQKTCCALLTTCCSSPITSLSPYCCSPFQDERSIQITLQQ